MHELQEGQHRMPWLTLLFLQCGKLEPLHAFDGAKRNCRVQLAKRRAANSASSRSASVSHHASDSNTPGAGTSSMLKTLGGGVRKASSIGGNLDKLAVQAHFLQQQQQAQQQAQLPSYQPQQEGQLLLQQEQDVSSRLQRIKQQLASMEQQLAMLHQQQQVEAQLAALQQQYDQMLQQHMRSQGLQTCLSGPLHVSGPNVSPLHTAPLHNVNSGALVSLTSPAAMPVVSAASAPIPAVTTACPTNGISFVPMIGRSVSHGWPMGSAAAAADAGAAAGFSGNLPPLRNSKCMPRPFGAMSAASSAGLSAPVPSLPVGLSSGCHASTSGPLPSGYMAGSLPGVPSNSQPLLLQPAALHPEAAGVMSMGMGGHTAVAMPQVGRHMPLLHVDDLPFSDDIPDLEAFLAAGGNLQPAGISSAHNALITSSTSNAVNQLTSSAQNTSANHAQAAGQVSGSANTLEGFLSPPLSAGQVHQGFACAGQAAAGMAGQHSMAAEAPAQLQASITGQHMGLPPYVPVAWAPGHPPEGPAAAAAAGVNVFGRRPGNTRAHNKPGRSSLDMFTGEPCMPAQYAAGLCWYRRTWLVALCSQAPAWDVQPRSALLHCG